MNDCYVSIYGNQEQTEDRSNAAQELDKIAKVTIEIVGSKSWVDEDDRKVWNVKPEQEVRNSERQKNFAGISTKCDLACLDTDNDTQKIKSDYKKHEQKLKEESENFHCG